MSVDVKTRRVYNVIKRREDMAKVRVNISVDQETIERLKQYATEQHSNVSQVITDWIWQQPLKSEKDEKQK